MQRRRPVAALLLPFLVACGAADPPGDAAGDSETDAVADQVDEGDGPADRVSDAAPEDGEADAPATCPRAGDPGPGTHRLTLRHDGRDREVLLHVPRGYDPSAPTPLVLNLHGYTSDAAGQVIFSDMNAAAAVHRFLVAYPEGVGRSWNGGTCCGDAAAGRIDDVGFLAALVEELAGRTCVDRERVYAAGMSNGGFMSYRLACEASELFAGFGPVAAGLGIADCAPARPRSLLAVHGTDDSRVDYALGEASFRRYAALAGCVGEPVRTPYADSFCDVYRDCADGVRVGLCTVTGLDHCWPGGPAPRVICETFVGAYSEDLNANDLLWAFWNE